MNAIILLEQILHLANVQTPTDQTIIHSFTRRRNTPPNFASFQLRVFTVELQRTAYRRPVRWPAPPSGVHPRCVIDATKHQCVSWTWWRHEPDMKIDVKWPSCDFNFQFIYSLMYVCIVYSNHATIDWTVVRIQCANYYYCKHSIKCRILQLLHIYYTLSGAWTICSKVSQCPVQLILKMTAMI